MKKRFLTLLITLIMALSLLLSGCSSKTSEESRETLALTDSSASISATSDEPAAGSSSSKPFSSGKTSGSDTAPDLAESKAETSTTTEIVLPEAAAPDYAPDYGVADIEAGDYAVMDSVAESAPAFDGGFATDDAMPADADFEYIEEAALESFKESTETMVEIEPESDYMLNGIHAGMLSAGEWNDNIHFDFFKDILQKSDGIMQSYQTYFEEWDLKPYNRVVVSCSDSDGQPLERAKVVVSDKDGNILSTAYTDNSGYAYCYYSLTNNKNDLPLDITAISPNAAESFTAAVAVNDLSDSTLVPFVFNDSNKERSLDLMFVVDTTGSMGDEMHFLQAELDDVIKRVRETNDNIPVRLSMNFYRDFGDDYVVRPYDFSTDITQQLSYLSTERAYGGGDYEEAVDVALLNAIEEHEWNEDNIKLMFMVLDAPPHKTGAVLANLKKAVAKAEELGIRIIPIASSGVDKSTEFLLRTLAMTTGGTYTFLTNDSGFGGSHIEPTIGDYTVEYLNNLLVRVINSYIGITDEVKPFVASQPVIEPIICDPIIIDDPDQGGLPVIIKPNPNYPDEEIVFDD